MGNIDEIDMHPTILQLIKQINETKLMNGMSEIKLAVKTDNLKKCTSDQHLV